MNILELLKGKKVRVLTDMKIEAVLEIKEVKKNSHREDLEPATPENDWWPASKEWDTYTVYFTNGAVKTYSHIEEIQIVE